jgi:hypothetical protein
LESSVVASSATLDFSTGQVHYSPTAPFSTIRDQNLQLNRIVAINDSESGHKKIRWASQPQVDGPDNNVILNEIVTDTNDRILTFRSRNIEFDRKDNNWRDSFANIFIAQKKYTSSNLNSKIEDFERATQIAPFDYTLPEQPIYDLFKDYGSELRFSYDTDSNQVRIEHWNTGLFFPHDSTSTEPIWGLVQKMTIERQRDGYLIEISSPKKDQDFTTLVTVLSTVADISKVGLRPGVNPVTHHLISEGKAFPQILDQPGSDQFSELVKESQEFRYVWNSLEILVNESSTAKADHFVNAIHQVAKSRIERSWFDFQFKTKFYFNPDKDSFLVMEKNIKIQRPGKAGGSSRKGWHVSRTEFHRNENSQESIESETIHFSRPNDLEKSVEMSEPTFERVASQPALVPIISGESHITNDFESILYSILTNNISKRSTSWFRYDLLK